MGEAFPSRNQKVSIFRCLRERSGEIGWSSRSDSAAKAPPRLRAFLLRLCATENWRVFPAGVDRDIDSVLDAFDIAYNDGLANPQRMNQTALVQTDHRVVIRLLDGQMDGLGSIY